MATIIVEILDYIKKSLWEVKKVDFSILYKKMEQENWIYIYL